MNPPIEGIIPVMLTPFKEDGTIDWKGYEALVEWYLRHGADALFAVCQSSEMHHLTLKERVELARVTVDLVKGRVPVVASGHISDAPQDQETELCAIANTGIDGLILVTNRLTGPAPGDGPSLRDSLKKLLGTLPDALPLGLYECPAPYRTLLSDDDVQFCAQSGRFVLLKDVSCDLETVARRVQLAVGSPLAILNANAAIAWPAMQAGSRGFCGVMNNFHPDLYSWLYRSRHDVTPLTDELAVFLVTSAMAETLGYPQIAKVHQRALGTFSSDLCRSNDDDIRSRVWALEAILGSVREGADLFRNKIARSGVQFRD